VQAGDYREVARLWPVKCTYEFEDVLAKYEVLGLVEVTIGIDSEGTPIYCVDEPVLEHSEERGGLDLVEIAARLVEAVVSEGLEGLPSNVEELKELSERYGIPYGVISENYVSLGYYVAKGLSGYGRLYPLVMDERIEEIAVNGPGKPALVFHTELDVGWLKTNISLSEAELDDLVIGLSRRAGRDLNLAHPYLEALTPEGHRIAATFSNEVSRFGSSLVVRKYRVRPILPHELIKRGTASPLLLSYLWFLEEHGGTLLIVGPTASGKTTFLQALLMLLPSSRRIVTIEDTPELNLSHHLNWDSLVTRHSYSLSEGEDVDLYKLAKFALRRRPDYFVIGEMRGEEARIFVQAAGSGHGALATFHGDSAESALQRLRADPIRLGDSYLQLIWAVVVLRRMRIPGRGDLRRVTSVVEVVPRGSSITLREIFSWNPDTDSFTPNAPAELVHLSYRLKRIAEVYGMSERDLKRELEEREQFLASVIDSNLSLFIKKLNEFYKNRDRRG
jgi:flagellar protein FlaI